MYIKEVIIAGFKSYREKINIDSFDQQLNVIVGRNGSGKSNFFHAIKFVLSNEYSHLGVGERQRLLHEGTGPRVNSSFVEIVIDNSDGRLPIAGDEVLIRRTIGAKSDQYYLNKKAVMRDDINNLLEAAGFSRSNPYYIVQQGKINQMATAPDKDRMKLLQEVAGTRVYDERREESKVMINEIESKLGKIMDLLQVIDEHLHVLQMQKEDFKKFRSLIETKKYLEHKILNREIAENQRKLDGLEPKFAVIKPKTEKLYAKVVFIEQETPLAIEKRDGAKKQVDIVEKESEILKKCQEQLLREKKELDLQIEDLCDEIEQAEFKKKKDRQELMTVEDEISLNEKELEDIKRRYTVAKRREEEISITLSIKETHRKELYAKQGRAHQFSSKHKRDEWLKKELASFNDQMKDTKMRRKEITENLKKNYNRREKLNEKLKIDSEGLKKMKQLANDHDIQSDEFLNKKNEAQARRKELWRTENDHQRVLADLKEELTEVDKFLYSMVGSQIMKGLDSVKKVLDTIWEHGDESDEIKSYHGPVIDNFECDGKIFGAVEAAVGNRLFHVIVENDKFGRKIVDEMNKRHLPGEVTFMPLNRLGDKHIEYTPSNDNFPIIGKLTFDNRFGKAMQNIFGKILLCRNLNTAMKVAESFECVTLDGDMISSSGSLSGGFNSRKSRIKAYIHRSEVMAKIENLENELSTGKENILCENKLINELLNKIQCIKVKQDKARSIYEKLKSEIRRIREELSAIERSITSEEESRAQCMSKMKELEVIKKSLGNEMRDDLMSQLSTPEQLLLDTLNNDIHSLSKEKNEAIAQRIKIEDEKTRLENILQNNLLRGKDELSQELQENFVEHHQRHLELLRAKNLDVENSLVKIDTDFEKLNERKEAAIVKFEVESLKVENLETEKKSIEKKLALNGTELQELINERNLLLENIEDRKQKIADLRSLPNVAADVTFDKMSTKDILKAIEKIQMQMKRFTGINENAALQFISISEGREEIVETRERLCRSLEKIQGLITTIEDYKSGAVDFTFNQVNRHFQQVFRKLIPSGDAKLRMTDDGDGIGISVRFSGSNESCEMEDIRTLSGGQSTIVALALIFAIQKCDPAPFYLFDEIDQALDHNHRESVAAMVHDLSSDAQFIMTTFRHELLRYADQFYGVKCENKVSYIGPVTREQAASFLDATPNE